MKRLYAIFGDPVAHSRSPLMHNYTFSKLGVDACYTRVHLKDGSKLREVFFALNLDGANVTLPHKEAAFAACDEVRGFASQIGVVNTLINEKGKLIGYNTDADGFEFSIDMFKNIEKVLILGAGGTAKALALKLSKRLNVSLLNRSKSRLEQFKKLGFTTSTWSDFEPQRYDLIVNTTSAGLGDEDLPAPIEILKPLLVDASLAVDVIYAKDTPFLKLCKDVGTESIGGEGMLLGQGVLASVLFCKEQFAAQEIESVMVKSFEL